jgi:hypothetical protein
MERTLWHLGLEEDHICVLALLHPFHGFRDALANALLTWKLLYSQISLHCTWLLGCRSCQASDTFFSEWSFVFREPVLTRPASTPEFFICFTEWRIEERRFPFLSI